MKEKQKLLDLDTILLTLVEDGNLSALRGFLSKPGVNINATNNMGHTALGVALERGYEEIAQLLLDHGAAQLLLDHGAALGVGGGVARVDVEPSAPAAVVDDGWVMVEAPVAPSAPVAVVARDWTVANFDARDWAALNVVDDGWVMVEAPVAPSTPIAVDDGWVMVEAPVAPATPAAVVAPSAPSAPLVGEDWQSVFLEADEMGWSMLSGAIDKQCRDQEGGGAAIVTEVVGGSVGMSVDNNGQSYTFKLASGNVVNFAPSAPAAVLDDGWVMVEAPVAPATPAAVVDGGWVMVEAPVASAANDAALDTFEDGVPVAFVEGRAMIDRQVIVDRDDGDWVVVNFAPLTPAAPMVVADMGGSSGESQGSGFSFGTAAMVATVVAVPVVAVAIATADTDTIVTIADNIFNVFEDVVGDLAEAAAGVSCILGVSSSCGGSML
ncbi:MAG: ankyrin repeat domain-containing protein [Rickettsiaceae bacterium]|nr:ankyrin repeat domain-containing protein [Rickettsiaceae bacterium]